MQKQAVLQKETLKKTLETNLRKMVKRSNMIKGTLSKQDDRTLDVN